jgi:DNA-binding MarR family transcriptional regulator
MSNPAMTWAFKQQVEPTGAKFVLVTLANYANPEGSCWKSQEQIAADTSQGIRSVQRHLADLEADGWIKSERRSAKDGTRLADGYKLVRFIESQHAKLAGSQRETTRQKRRDNPPITTRQPAKLAATIKEGLSHNRTHNEPTDTQQPPTSAVAMPNTPRPNPLWDALEVEWGPAPKGTPKHGQFVKAVDIYRKAGFTPEMVEAVHRKYQEDEFFGTLNYSIMAVANRAQELLTKRPRLPSMSKSLKAGITTDLSDIAEEYERNGGKRPNLSSRNGFAALLPAAPAEGDGRYVDTRARVLPARD